MDGLLKLHNELLKTKSINSLLFHGYSFVDNHILSSLLQNPHIQQWIVCIREGPEYDSELKNYTTHITKATAKQPQIFLKKIIFVRVPGDLIFSEDTSEDKKFDKEYFYSEGLQSKFDENYDSLMNDFDFSDLSH